MTEITLYDLKEEIGELLKKVIIRTGKGQITDMIGYGQQKYGEELTVELLTDIGCWSIYYCDYYNILELEEGDPIEDDKYIPLLIELKKYLEKVMKNEQTTSPTRKKTPPRAR